MTDLILRNVTQKQLDDLNSQMQDANKFPDAPSTETRLDGQDPKYRKEHWQIDVARRLVGRTIKMGSTSVIRSDVGQIKKNGWYKCRPRPASSLYIPTLQGRFEYATVLLTDAGGKVLDWCATAMGLTLEDRIIRLPVNETFYLEVNSGTTDGANNVVFNLL